MRSTAELSSSSVARGARPPHLLADCGNPHPNGFLAWSHRLQWKRAARVAPEVPVSPRAEVEFEHPAGEFLPSAITETMYIGNDGLVHQSRNSTCAWKSVFVSMSLNTEGDDSKLVSATDQDGRSIVAAGHLRAPPASMERNGAKFERAASAIEVVREHDINSLSNEELYTRVKDQLTSQKQPPVGKDTVLRAAGRRLT